MYTVWNPLQQYQELRTTTTQYQSVLTLTDDPLPPLLSTLNLGTSSSSSLAEVPTVAPRMSSSSLAEGIPTVNLHNQSQQFAVIRLPEMTLPKFFGNSLEWLTFWEYFNCLFTRIQASVEYRILIT